MNCNTAKSLLATWHDDELDADLATQVGKHLQTCAACREEHQSMQRIGRVLAQDFQAEVPADLANRAFFAAMRSAPRAPSFLKTLFPIAWPAALATSTAALVLVAWSWTIEPSTQIANAHLFENTLGISSTQQVNGILYEALGIEADSESGGAG